MRLPGSRGASSAYGRVGRIAGVQAAVDAVEPGDDLRRDREVRVGGGLGRPVLQVRRRVADRPRTIAPLLSSPQRMRSGASDIGR